jgi:hypothetical protein
VALSAQVAVGERLRRPVCAGAGVEHVDVGEREAVGDLDPAALVRLAAELESDDLARSIARTYLRMLDSRLSRAASALDRRDEVDAMDVLLSLRVSSATLGLVRLETAVLHVIDAVRQGEPVLARERGSSMLALASGARSALGAHLDDASTSRRSR